MEIIKNSCVKLRAYCLMALLLPGIYGKGMLSKSRHQITKNGLFKKSGAADLPE